jgi:hypothetical protein
MRVFILAALLALTACDEMPTLPGAVEPAAIEALEARVTLLEDERAIQAVVDVLDLAVDAKDWPTVRAQFADQLQADFSTLDGAPAGEVTADDLIAGWRSNLFEGKASFHMRGGARVAIEGDTARLITMGYAWNLLPARPDNNLWEVWGRYEFGLIRGGQGWKINAISFTALHERGDPSVRTESLRP